MSEESMVERVAKAICENSGQSWQSAAEGYRDICDGFARAAIEAMREPTDAMVGSCGNGECAKWAPGAWQNYIDAALKEPA